MTIISNRRNVIVDDDEQDYDENEPITISTAIATATDRDDDEDSVDEEEETVSPVAVDDQDSIEDEWQIRRAAAVRTVLPELDGPSARDMEREERDWAEVDTTDSADALDDPVRMYLREIGRVDLLTSADERRLARELEGLNHLVKLEQELAERAQRRCRGGLPGRRRHSATGGGRVGGGHGAAGPYRERCPAGAFAGPLS